MTSRHKPVSQRTVPIVVFDGVNLLDVAGPMQVFADALLPDGGPAYDCFLIAARARGVLADTGVALPARPFASLKRQPIDTLLVMGGDDAESPAQDRKLVNGVTRLAGRSRRVGAVCTGTFILAATGLLAGRRAVTHWSACARLRSLYSDIAVEVDPIFIKDGHLWTSGGVTAGIDLALAMVAEDLGRPAALRTAKRLVMPMLRPGGQAQFSSLLTIQCADATGRFEALHAWMADNLAADLRVERLAERVHMSPRSFARHYREVTRRTPAKAVEAMRIDAAKALLEGTAQSVTAVARACGFGNEERMRRAFLRSVKVAPSAYRAAFGAPAASSASRVSVVASRQ
ncbi:GlxA family transcriptional regulator [Pelagibius sp.]|uniref:GlxA family transcriptional regulator n=1 Tax=Pelagibius sp. TaxID=1931238 RepID=UPI002620DBD9|nr:helix-turn-helix domain-containing protein [Pelagibius sp.]